MCLYFLSFNVHAHWKLKLFSDEMQRNLKMFGATHRINTMKQLPLLAYQVVCSLYRMLLITRPITLVGSGSMEKWCPHCQQSLSRTGFYQHKKLFFRNGTWITEKKGTNFIWNSAEFSEWTRLGIYCLREKMPLLNLNRMLRMANILLFKILFAQKILWSGNQPLP